MFLKRHDSRLQTLKAWCASQTGFNQFSVIDTMTVETKKEGIQPDPGHLPKEGVAELGSG